MPQLAPLISKLTGKEFSRTMNAEESVARGTHVQFFCKLSAVLASTRFFYIACACTDNEHLMMILIGAHQTGAALQCAMLSPTFRVREFKAEDSNYYPINLVWKDLDSESMETEEYVDMLYPPFFPFIFSVVLFLGCGWRGW
jgi:hypothetical protein